MFETFVDRCDDIMVIDASVRNRFRWSWLEEKDSLGNLLSDYMRKIPAPGFCYCLICNRRLSYGGKGKSVLTRHAEILSHKARSKELKKKQTGSFDEGAANATGTALGPSQPSCDAAPKSECMIDFDTMMKDNCSSSTEPSMPDTPPLLCPEERPFLQKSLKKKSSILDNPTVSDQCLIPSSVDKNSMPNTPPLLFQKKRPSTKKSLKKKSSILDNPPVSDQCLIPPSLDKNSKPDTPLLLFQKKCPSTKKSFRKKTSILDNPPKAEQCLIPPSLDKNFDETSRGLITAAFEVAVKNKCIDSLTKKMGKLKETCIELKGYYNKENVKRRESRLATMRMMLRVNNLRLSKENTRLVSKTGMLEAENEEFKRKLEEVNIRNRDLLKKVRRHKKRLVKLKREKKSALNRARYRLKRSRELSRGDISLSDFQHYHILPETISERSLSQQDDISQSGFQHNDILPETINENALSQRDNISPRGFQHYHILPDFKIKKEPSQDDF